MADTEQPDELDGVFRALADPTRRRILDLLQPGPRTTGQIAEQFPALSRFAVMKHLAVLVAAKLVLVRREGRRRYNYLNPVPLRQMYERWMGPYTELWSASLLRLKEVVEGKRP
jgi:DNA-binding transcriptional ArsR family regulator